LLLPPLYLHTRCMYAHPPTCLCKTLPVIVQPKVLLRSQACKQIHRCHFTHISVQIRFVLFIRGRMMISSWLSPFPLPKTHTMSCYYDWGESAARVAPFLLWQVEPGFTMEALATELQGSPRVCIVVKVSLQGTCSIHNQVWEGETQGMAVSRVWGMLAKGKP
jgi:hypothetical protein